MAFRLIIAVLLSLIFHLIIFYKPDKKNDSSFISKGESILVDVLPGGGSKSTPLKSNRFNKNVPAHEPSQPILKGEESAINAESGSGSDRGTGDGAGNGSGSGIQTDWMIEKPAYSEESRRNEEEGTVIVTVACKVSGGCSGIIKKSSGYSRLDQSVLKTVSKIKVSKDEIRELSFVFRLNEDS